MIVQVLLSKYLKFPENDELRRVIDGFQHKFRFPQCVVVDGTHIPIVSPDEYPADYFNRKGWHSVLLQGTVNHLGMFIDIYIGWLGRVHDARVFANSGLYKKCHEGLLLPDWKESIENVDIPLLLLGDPAYPLMPWLMKSHINNGNLSNEQKTFNYRLSRARVVVEHTYGRLKGRWCCLLKRLDVNINYVPVLLTACCVLHNICEVHGESFSDNWLEDVGPIFIFIRRLTVSSIYWAYHPS